MTTHLYADAVHRDALALHADLESGHWRPLGQERDLAHDLALAVWGTAALRTALHDVPDQVRTGRLADALAPAAALLEWEREPDDPALLAALRRLVDAVAA